MIPSLALLAVLWAPARAQDAGAAGEDADTPPAGADTPPSEDPAPEEDALSPFRTPFDVLAKRTIGSTSRPVEYNWRRSRVQLGATGDHLYELNNFNSLRAGGVVRLPRSGLMYELGLSHVWVWDTPSSELLALTPYRQPGRPQRLELDFTIGMPFAEGVVTTFPRIFPAVEMVFAAYGSLRYLVYPGGFEGMRVGQVARAALSPVLSEAELDNLEDKRLAAMQVDDARYGILVGVGNDLYFRQGIFVSPRALFALPLLAPVTQTDLLFWGEFSLQVGVAL